MLTGPPPKFHGTRDIFIPGPERAASSSVARPMRAAVGMTPSADAEKIMTAPACTTSNTTATGMNGTVGRQGAILRGGQSVASLRRPTS